MDAATFTTTLLVAGVIFGLGFLCGLLSVDTRLPPVGMRAVLIGSPPRKWIEKHGHLFVRVTMYSGTIIRTKVRNVNWENVRLWHLDGARA